MCKRFALAGLALLAAACIREPLFPGTPRSSHEPHVGHRTDSSARTDVVPPGEHVYLTAVRFPDGFAWQEDTCAVEGTVWIDLYRDGDLVRSVPAGGSIHPDMHRCAGGHLYADRSGDSTTVVSRDGAELFRFAGREAIRGFLVREDGIHTLGQDRDGDGFTYRVDGRVVHRSETGRVLGGTDRPGAKGGALTEDGEYVFYACRLPSERGKKHVVMRDAEVFRTLQEDDDILAFDFVGGKACRVRTDWRRIHLCVDDQESLLKLSPDEYLVWSRMAAWEDDVLVLLHVAGLKGKRHFLQTADGRIFQGKAGETAEDLLVEGKRMGWTVIGDKGDLLRVRWSDGTATEIGGGFLASSRCVLLHEGHLFVALTGRDGAPNRFLQDGKSVDLPFNGYFTSVTVE